MQKTHKTKQKIQYKTHQVFYSLQHKTIQIKVLHTLISKQNKTKQLMGVFQTKAIRKTKVPRRLINKLSKTKLIRKMKVSITNQIHKAIVP